jgi:hypothetical protein
MLHVNMCTEPLPLLLLRRVFLYRDDEILGILKE